MKLRIMKLRIVKLRIVKLTSHSCLFNAHNSKKIGRKLEYLVMSSFDMDTSGPPFMSSPDNLLANSTDGDDDDPVVIGCENVVNVVIPAAGASLTEENRSVITNTCRKNLDRTADICQSLHSPTRPTTDISAAADQPFFGPFLSPSPSFEEAVVTNDSNSSGGHVCVPEDEAGLLFGLADSGLIGTAAACAISSSRPACDEFESVSCAQFSDSVPPRDCVSHRVKSSLRGEGKQKLMFEPNPTLRKRLQTRYIRKIKALLQEYCVRVGEQAAFVSCKPSSATNDGSLENFRCFGANPLETVIRNMQSAITHSLCDHLSLYGTQNSHKHKLPPLVVSGIPTPLEKMTQSQLRSFIPLMMKRAMGKAKFVWKEEQRPVWWPDGVPFENVRSDSRTQASERAALPWNTALRNIVRNCYEHFGEEHLLHPWEQCHTQTVSTRMDEVTEPGVVFHVLEIKDGAEALHHQDILNSFQQVQPKGFVGADSTGDKIMSTEEYVVTQ